MYTRILKVHGKEYVIKKKLQKRFTLSINT